MISEKTAELNLTAELLNWLGVVTRQTFVALAPSQRAEGRLGYDASFHGGGTAVALIQFKRAYVRPPIWEWHLNRTKRKDQHRRLMYLEQNGFPVLYAFPFFATPAELQARRRQLLVFTFWYPPSFIKPAGPPDTHHEVCHDTSTGRWWVQSERPVDLRPPLTVGAVLGPISQEPRLGRSLEEFVGALNELLVHYDDVEAQGEDGGANDLAGQALLVVYP